MPMYVPQVKIMELDCKSKNNHCTLIQKNLNNLWLRRRTLFGLFFFTLCPGKMQADWLHSKLHFQHRGKNLPGASFFFFRFISEYFLCTQSIRCICLHITLFFATNSQMIYAVFSNSKEMHNIVTPGVKLKILLIKNYC